MKLEDLLAKYLPEWPDGAEYARQDKNLEICFMGDCSTLHDFFITQLAEDAGINCGIGTKRVYMNQYIAARDRLHAKTLAEMKEAPPKAQDSCKEIWLEVAKSEFASMAESFPELTPWQRAEFAFDAADAFCAEMNKRI